MHTVEIMTVAGTLVGALATLIKLRRDRARPASPFARWWRDRRPTPPNDPRPE